MPGIHVIFGIIIQGVLLFGSGPVTIDLVAINSTDTDIQAEILIVCVDCAAVSEFGGGVTDLRQVAGVDGAIGAAFSIGAGDILVFEIAGGNTLTIYIAFR